MKILNDINKDSDDPLDIAKRDYFQQQVISLEKIIPLVELQMKKYADIFSCTEEPFSLLLYDVGIPAFSSINREKEIDYLWEKLKEEQNISLLEILQVILIPLAMLMVGILNYIKKS